MRHPSRTSKPKLSIELPSELIAELKEKAALEGYTIKELATQWIQDYLSR